MSNELDDDDPQLKSLRAVWLSLPDEDPPERGLSELMAAARVKAEAMAKPEGRRQILTQRGQRRIVEHVVSGSRDIHALNRPSVVSAR